MFLSIFFVVLIVFHANSVEQPKCGESEELGPDCNSCIRSCDGVLACTRMACPPDSPKKCVCKVGFQGSAENCVPC
uniref:Uncharacterized protein n=1 Tax=Acrobeloides nanus TaxID=290746 RepID=A0A914DBQ8_9BILA